MKSYTIVSFFILVALLFSGCTTNKSEAENILFTGIIESIEENTWLVSTTDDVGFDQASVTLTNRSEERRVGQECRYRW